MITSPAAPPRRLSLMKKQIPTLLGLIILIAGLAIGAFLFRSGTGVFLPRATPETTPKSIRVSNVTYQGFSITFLTDTTTSGFIRYGTDPKKLTQIGDQRDQLTNTIGEYTLHQISILRGLEANTTYYYVLGTGKGALFDDEGKPFTITTAKQAGTQPKALTVFGSAVTASGAPAAGAVVFVTPPNARTLSSLVTSAGSWAASLSNARTLDGAEYAKVAVGDELLVQLMAVDPAENTELNAKVETDAAIAIQLGQKGTTAAAPETGTAPLIPAPTATPSAGPDIVSISSSSGKRSAALGTMLGPDDTGSPSGSDTRTNEGEDASKSAKASESAKASTPPTSSPPPTPVATTPTQEITTFTVDTPEVVTVTTAQPTITGKVTAQAVVTIQIHSEAVIDTQVTADENGEFSIDLTQYQQTLEPGEHTITYSYEDPQTGEIVTKTKTFVVAPRVTLAAASPSPTPYGSTNPYPITSPQPTATSTTGTRSGGLATNSGSTRSSTSSTTVSSNSGLPTSGSVGTTVLLIGGGLFFLISGFWSWWISRELVEEYS